MINEAIQLFGFLVLAFLGIVAPFFMLILSISREGRKELIIQYTEEIKLYEEKIKNKEEKESKKIEDIEKKVKDINKDIEQLKEYKKNSQKNLSNLDIRKQTLYIFIPLIISFILADLSLIFSHDLLTIEILMFLAVGIFFYSLFKLWKALCIIIVVRNLIDDKLGNYRNKTIELLEKLNEDKYNNLKQKLPENEGKKFELMSAIYGTDKQFIDVTEKLKPRIKENKLTVTSSNKIDGDPHPGVKKKLVIDYISVGKEYRIEIPENETRSIP